MAKITLSGKTIDLIKIKAISLDEFIPIIEFQKDDFIRLETMRVIKDNKRVTLSNKIEFDQRKQDVFVITTGPGAFTLPFIVKKGASTWDDDGYISFKLTPSNNEIKIQSSNKIKAKYGSIIRLSLELTGYKEKEAIIDFYANDDEKDYNTGEYANIHCGRIKIKMVGSSQVGYRLLSNIDSLPNAPLNYVAPLWDTTNPEEITLSQKQANLYANCEGVCYATTASRANKAYQDLFGTGIIDLTVSKHNVDHRIAATYGTKDPFMGYGAGGPFARHGVGQTIDDSGVWAGQLKPGALVQIWKSIDSSNLYQNGGHSVIFRSYFYDNDGKLAGFHYSDYHGREIGKIIRNKDEPNKTLLGVNLLDR